jgi:hypothetical protein
LLTHGAVSNPACKINFVTVDLATCP